MNTSIKNRLLKVAEQIEQRTISVQETKMKEIRSAIFYQQGLLKRANLRVAQAIQTNVGVDTAIDTIVKVAADIEFLGKALTKITAKRQMKTQTTVEKTELQTIRTILQEAGFNPDDAENLQRNGISSKN